MTKIKKSQNVINKDDLNELLNLLDELIKPGDKDLSLENKIDEFIRKLNEQVEESVYDDNN